MKVDREFNLVVKEKKVIPVVAADWGHHPFIVFELLVACNFKEPHVESSVFKPKHDHVPNHSAIFNNFQAAIDLIWLDLKTSCRVLNISCGSVIYPCLVFIGSVLAG